LFLQFGFMLLGFGCAPVFPAMLHETPGRFGKPLSQTLVGLQMGCAYIGSTFMPPLFGAIAQVADISLFPYFLLAILALMVLAAENINRVMKRTQGEVYLTADTAEHGHDENGP
jgi:fucose permease